MSRIKKEHRAKTSVYREQNAISDQLHERADCAVRAAALVCGVSYAEMRDTMAALGRKPRQGTADSITFAALAKYGKVATKVHRESFLSRYPAPYCRTVKNITTHHMVRFSKVWADGRTYLLWTRGHILTVVNGVNHDHTRGRAKRVLEVALVHDVGTKPEQLGFRLTGNYMMSAMYVLDCEETSHIGVRPRV